MTGTAGRRALVNITGVAVGFADEACTDAGAHLVYQITNAVKRVWDPTVAIVVKRDAVIAAPALYTLNRLTGRITFLVANGAGVVVTVTGSYLPLTVALGARAFSYMIEQTVIDDTDFDSANTMNGMVQVLPSLMKVSGTLGRRWRMEHYFEDAIMNQTQFVIEFFSDRAQAFDLRVWAQLSKSDLTMALAADISGSIGFTGFGDADLRVISTSTQ